jgi:3-hydroxyacyl-CoA dehydrogenase/enoyl-CoA hydratase/3-hydroxybutyryl-CoA epimerase
LHELITSTLEADGLLLATIDMTDRTMNVFSFALMDALDALMDRVEQDDAVKAVVLTSGKSTFLAGADLVMVRGFCTEARTATHARMFEQCGRLGRQFVRLEYSSKPWVAATNGLALGGGLELTMACRARIVSDDKRIQLGLPEIRWGLLPGAGGTQRLPRMVGYEKGLELLLTGRSLSPEEAVHLGLFTQAVPIANLLDSARTIARSLIGKAYSPVEKFPNLDQSDIPVYSKTTARQVAMKFGVTEETFDLYPAFSAIIDSVLKGAREPLAQATTIEMNEFLRLMFSPVAGRMVRTLFLGRVQAERELAAPKGTKITKILMGPLSDAQKAWADVLAKLKIEKLTNPQLPADHIELVDEQGCTHRLCLQNMDSHTSTAGNDIAVVLAPNGPYGRVMEIVGPANSPLARAAAALAGQMRTLPWPSNGTRSVLQALQNQPLQEQASRALQWAAQPGTGDISHVDVAACLAGVSPGWTGGPLSWLWDEQKTQMPLLDATAKIAWRTVMPRLAEACE